MLHPEGIMPEGVILKLGHLINFYEIFFILRIYYCYIVAFKIPLRLL